MGPRPLRLSGALALSAVAGLFAASCEPAMPVGSVEVLETLSHDTSAYTQGLVFQDGVLYESTGRYGASTVRRVDPATGEVLARVPLPEEYFGEGLAAVDGRLVQLTWQEGVALVYDRETLALEDSVSVPTHGWGLCFDGESLYMTTGSSILYRRDPETLMETGSVQITRGGASLARVNELECVGEHIYANVYQSTDILQIHKGTGEVVAEFDAASLVPAGVARGDPDRVLNGIAYDPASESFYLTGKLWPVMYRVRLVDEGSTR